MTKDKGGTELISEWRKAFPLPDEVDFDEFMKALGHEANSEGRDRRARRLNGLAKNESSAITPLETLFALLYFRMTQKEANSITVGLGINPAHEITRLLVNLDFFASIKNGDLLEYALRPEIKRALETDAGIARGNAQNVNSMGRHELQANKRINNITAEWIKRRTEEEVRFRDEQLRNTSSEGTQRENNILKASAHRRRELFYSQCFVPYVKRHNRNSSRIICGEGIRNDPSWTDGRLQFKAQGIQDDIAVVANLRNLVDDENAQANQLAKRQLWKLLAARMIKSASNPLFCLDFWLGKRVETTTTDGRTISFSYLADVVVRSMAESFLREGYAGQEVDQYCKKLKASINALENTAKTVIDKTKKTGSPRKAVFDGRVRDIEYVSDIAEALDDELGDTTEHDRAVLNLAYNLIVPAFLGPDMAEHASDYSKTKANDYSLLKDDSGALNMGNGCLIVEHDIAADATRLAVQIEGAWLNTTSVVPIAVFGKNKNAVSKRLQEISREQSDGTNSLEQLLDSAKQAQYDGQLEICSTCHDADNVTMSRVHCLVAYYDKQLSICDLGSSLGVVILRGKSIMLLGDVFANDEDVRRAAMEAYRDCCECEEDCFVKKSAEFLGLRRGDRIYLGSPKSYWELV